MSKEDFTKIVNFMTTRARILVQGRGDISDVVKKNIISFKIFSTLRHWTDKLRV